MKLKLKSLLVCAALAGFGTAQAAYLSVNDATKNNVRAKALSLDGQFVQTYDANINDGAGRNISTSARHASVNAVSQSDNNGRDWYSFTTTTANVDAFFDIDFGMTDLDSWVKLFDANGSLIAENDDGRIADAGSTSGWDSFLSATLGNPGLFYLSVGSYNTNNGKETTLKKNQDYTLHVALRPFVEPTAQMGAIVQTPIPAAVWLFGSSILGLIGVCRRVKPNVIAA
jgi:hypothetical protein